jgi:DNA-binding transcriptional MerR regulator
VTSATESGADLTIDDLARQAQLPVRTIREYHTMRLLPPPERRGRVGIYGAPHIQRLELIGRLQRRGYSLAGIRDLLQAWDAGSDLTALLGVEPAPAALDETPLRLTRAELTARLPELTGAALDRACAARLVEAHGDVFAVRSPALLALVADGTASGIPLTEMLDLVEALNNELTGLSDVLADLIVERMLRPLSAAGRLDDLPALLQRGRHLLLQGIASVLAGRLAEDLLERSVSNADGAALRAALDRVRIGVVADADGHIQHRASQ